MCKKVTLYLALANLALTMAIASGQAPATDWRPVGNTLRDLSLAGLAGGPVSRVWFSEDGQTLFAKTREGKVFQTLDRESWSASQAPEPAQWEPPISLAPEFGARTRPGKNGKLYAFGQFVYSSWSGANWDNLTAVRVPGGLASLVGRGIVDLAASPRDTGLGEEELAIAGEAGVFRSIDGGKSWSAINAGLPNFPGRRIAALPNGDRGVQVETSSTASRSRSRTSDLPTFARRSRTKRSVRSCAS